MANGDIALLATGNGLARITIRNAYGQSNGFWVSVGEPIRVIECQPFEVICAAHSRAMANCQDCVVGSWIERGTAEQYLAMNIGWMLGYGRYMTRPDETEANNMFRAERPFLNEITDFGTFLANRSDGPHIGIDIRYPNVRGYVQGRPVLAVTSGEVVFVQRVADPNIVGAGHVIAIQSDTHRDPRTNQYLIFIHSHLRYAPTLRVNDRVYQGQVIGFAGNSGAVGSSAGHLHFEVSNSGNRRVFEGTRQARAANRVQPRYFYPEDAFTGNLIIRDERW